MFGPPWFLRFIVFGFLWAVCTSFTRFVVVIGLLRQAIGTQGLPPSQIVVGLSLLLTFVAMAPTLDAMWEEGLQPYLDTPIDQRACAEPNQREAVCVSTAFKIPQTVRTDSVRRKKHTPVLAVPIFYVVSYHLGTPFALRGRASVATQQQPGLVADVANAAVLVKTKHTQLNNSQQQQV